MTHAVTWRDQHLPIKYSRRKTLALHVKEGVAEVRSPVGVDVSFIQRFVTEKDAWLLGKIQQHRQLAAEKPDLFSLNAIPFMGLNIQVNKVVTGRSSGWEMTAQGLTVELKADDRKDYLQVLQRFYRHQARLWLNKKTLATAERFGEITRLKGVRLRNTKSKWGHCTAEGVIQFNWLIMMAPEQTIDYLVAHEVCHLRFMHHQPSFWQAVATLHPSYREDRQWLSDNGHKLVLE